MEMTPIHPLPTQTSPRPVMPDGPLFRYIRQLQQVTGIYRWSHLRVVLYLLDSPSCLMIVFLAPTTRLPGRQELAVKSLPKPCMGFRKKACRENPGRGWKIHPKLMEVRNAFYRESVRGNSETF